MELKGIFTLLEGVESPIPGTIITDEDMDEIIDIIAGDNRLHNLIPGAEFRFEAEDGEVYLDDWSSTPGTGCCRSLPLHLAGEPWDADLVFQEGEAYL